jgi:hypothetical protein
VAGCCNPVSTSSKGAVSGVTSREKIHLPSGIKNFECRADRVIIPVVV